MKSNIANTEFIDNLMQAALAEAAIAAKQGEVPVGAVVSDGKEIISRAHNIVEVNHDPAGHAEVLALREAAKKLGDWRLNDLILCVTLEPCTMCLGAIKQARIATVVFGAHDAERGACGSLYDLSLDARVGPVPKVISGIRENESVALLQEFFKAKR